MVKVEGAFLKGLYVDILYVSYLFVFFRFSLYYQNSPPLLSLLMLVGIYYISYVTISWVCMCEGSETTAIIGFAKDIYSVTVINYMP